MSFLLMWVSCLFVLAASTWSKMKPSSRGKEYGGLKWERVKVCKYSF